MKDTLARIESYGFKCEAGPLTSCVDWARLRKVLDSPAYEPIGEVTPFGIMLHKDRIPEAGTQVFAGPTEPFSAYQGRVNTWVRSTFGLAHSMNIHLRSHRFLEEALELSQAAQCTRTEAHKIVDYVYDRLMGEPAQEVGGTMVTLSALCTALGVDMRSAAETELANVYPRTDKIRDKDSKKPRFHDE